MFAQFHFGYAALSALHAIAGITFAQDGFIVHAVLTIIMAAVYASMSRHEPPANGK